MGSQQIRISNGYGSGHENDESGSGIWGLEVGGVQEG